MVKISKSTFESLFRFKTWPKCQFDLSRQNKSFSLSNFVIWALNEQKMIFLLKVIYVWKELVWNISFDLTQPSRNHFLSIRMNEPLFLLSRSTMRAQNNQTTSCSKRKYCASFYKKSVDLDFIEIEILTLYTSLIGILTFIWK